MKCIIKIVNWIRKETWWRPYYKRVTLDEKTAWGGRCLQCHAGSTEDDSIRCNVIDNKCPCKWNQCLKLK